jgi:hypothetical protein
VYTWAPRDCRAANGSRSLFAVGGGADGASHPCGGAPYPAGVASSALLYLDLSRFRSARTLALSFDIWADAEPHEGVFVNYVEFDAAGLMTERRIVYSGTGRVQSWLRGLELDLTRLRDRQDGSWSGDLRGQRVYLELLFVSSDEVNLSRGEGVFLDNLAIESDPFVTIVPPAPTATPTPVANPSPTPAATPGTIERTVACEGGPGCGSLGVRSFLDYNCDGRYQPGLDRPVTTRPRVDVVAGAEILGTSLSLGGSAFFRLPTSAGVSVQLAVPEGMGMCSGWPNPIVLTAEDFGQRNNKQVVFPLRRQ